MFHRICCLLVLAILTAVSPAWAADMFLTVEGIPGDSLDPRHRGAIDVLSYSFGNRTTGTAAYGGGAGAGKTAFNDLVITKQVDSSSPRLMLGCASGTHFRKVVLNVRKPGAPQDYVTITLTDVLITSFRQGAGDEKALAAGVKGTPIEDVSFNYARIEFTYGQPGGATTKTGWDIRANTAIK